ncbi:hypothetical protein MXT31_16905 [Klebsiella pneumoniae]|jgi:hypothetical protein|uniref:hypothetical protein n=1 Tax=Klebsiella pneumoniae TaxID=573 RepID=UPI002072FD8C|nr:hypothetical protein [Klebsiella pneumoniae]MCJ7148951.1 hypothetical protein [Klebsiella pneumoniae]MCM5896143.1 hypothetical protein [Klebsiella pneumoniae]MCM6041471.1 hypothetical protein [Klebsiella pneumoniae]MCQ0732779.1 hypothetical protein [Klebsiella pneumoniae]MCU7633505.1 hypothetical protein [Klebsiella pneumoniae]
MTDITELAQREKFEAWAEEAGALPWGILKKHRNQDGNYPGPHYTYMWKAWKAAGAELVEALEKAQQVDEELCKLLPIGAEYMDPPDGGDVTPLEGVRRMVADYRQRIADLESRTITFKLPFTPEPSAFAPWAAKAFYQFHKDTVKSCVAVFSDACAAAGIKVEVE